MKFKLSVIFQETVNPGYSYEKGRKTYLNMDWRTKGSIKVTLKGKETVDDISSVSKGEWKESD
jgi:hypothetical protein